MPVQKTQAIVIRSFPLGEFDKIITLYTADFGKVRAVARRLRRPKNHFGGSLELLNYGALVFFERPNKDLHTINDFDLIDAFEPIKADFDRTAYGCYLAELVDAIEPGQAADQSVFHLLRHTFETLMQIDDIALLARAFELQLLGLTGFAPQLMHCVVCTKTFRSATVHFSSCFGGLLCIECADQDAEVMPIARGSCELMKQLQKSDQSYLTRFRASDLNHRELKFVLSNFISYHTERTLKSLAFLEDLENVKH